MHDGVRTFGDHIVPREFRHNDLLRLAGKPFRTGRIEAGDPNAADLLPRVIPAAGIADDGHVERDTLDGIEHAAGRCENRLRHHPVFGFARIEIRAVGMLLELHDMAAAVHMSGLPARSLGVPSGLVAGPSKHGMKSTDSFPSMTCSSGAQKQPVMARPSAL